MPTPNTPETLAQKQGRREAYRARCKQGRHAEQKRSFCSGSQYAGDPPVRSWLTRLLAPRIALTRCLDGVSKNEI